MLDVAVGLLHVRFGSEADICVINVMSALPSKADMCGAHHRACNSPSVARGVTAIKCSRLVFLLRDHRAIKYAFM